MHSHSLHTRALSLSLHPLPPFKSQEKINKLIQGRRAMGLLQAMFGVLAHTELYLTLGEISWMSVELFWDSCLLLILRKGVISASTHTNMDNWPCKEETEVSHESDLLSARDANATSSSALHVFPPLLWVFMLWEHTDGLLTVILLVQPNVINLFLKRIFNSLGACGR